MTKAKCRSIATPSQLSGDELMLLPAKLISSRNKTFFEKVLEKGRRFIVKCPTVENLIGVSSG